MSDMGRALCFGRMIDYPFNAKRPLLGIQVVRCLGWSLFHVLCLIYLSFLDCYKYLSSNVNEMLY